MILVDTDVLIDALRTANQKYPVLFAAHGAAVCGITIAEVLHGAHDAHHYVKLQTALARFPYLDFPEPLWAQVAEHLFRLRTSGITVPFQDAAIATLATSLDVELWSRDRHYVLIQSVVPNLKLFAEPP